ncbi:MAG: 3-phosphoserine/phosphohydroxythreonine transaminase [Bacillota bacterium]|nr:3-phosphoserine/phosphohydroxythreonine transaminase [Bacillota bacterium]
MMNRVFNFYAGPATLPVEVLQIAQEEFLNYKGLGMSIMEISHRAKEFEAIIHEAEANVKELLGISDNYKVLFLQGGASNQFSMVPQNFLKPEMIANYVVTGSFAEKAYKEAKNLGQAHVAATTKEYNHDRIPGQEEIALSDNPAYVHITTNNTIFGTQYKYTPDFGNIPLVADMSSDIMCQPIAASRYSLIYAGAQKNLGPSGVTLVVINKEMLENAPKSLPSMLRYDLMAENDSLYNTPPSFSIYILNLVLQWLKEKGGLSAMAKHNQEKAALVYQAIDNSRGFYKGHAQKESRSLMNVTFTLPSTELEKKFLMEAEQHNLVGLKGHRSVGGMRASIYNAMPKEGCQALSDFMKDFMEKNG